MDDTPVLYGLENCDTCRKARTWLDRHGVAHRFVDYRAHRQSPETLKRWARGVGGFEALVNRSGTTWRQLPEARRLAASDPEWTLLLREHPTLVRRPVLELGDQVYAGWTPKRYGELFGA